MSNISPKLVKHIAKLANIPISEGESKNLANAFGETLEVVNQLQQVDTKDIDTTHQVTGLKNVLREDKVIEEEMFTQEEALANAKDTYQGYFVVPKILQK
ncbi:MAG: Aspartyl/glutamyl-tRNA(Asn/Gln) amidotransferase subunit C [Microgenomates bacterium 39_7]|nr:MAG: Aspartyl/glutamyl-tRNA(Asn/Gln) amidotransferase subunit C [Microgenomates bacterium 39_7]